IHHDDTASDSPPIFAAVTAAARHGMSPCAAATTSHSTGPGAIMRSAVALTAPTLATTSAATAAYRHRRRVAASAVSPTSQGSPAQGSSIALVRDTYGSRYGDST